MRVHAAVSSSARVGAWRRFCSARMWSVLAFLSGCALPQPPPCGQPAGRDCMAECMACGHKDYGPCRASCMSVGGVFDGRPTLPEAMAPEPEPAPPEPQPAAERRLSDVPFPPADLTAPHPRSAKDGDGRWLRLGQPGDCAAEGEALLFHTTMHPHPVSAFDALTLVAIDLARAEVHFMPGSRDPGADQLDPPAGLVPEAQRDALVAVFNGGWLPRHGRWGMAAGDQVLVPPRQEGCTVALYRDGRVRIASWSELAGEVDALAAYRQTPPCMVEQGKLHPLLDAGNEEPWGGHDPRRKTRRRSALGIDASGRILFYGFGVEVGPELLARGMLHGGAVAVAELDINWSWTRFLLFGESNGSLAVTSTLVPKMTHSKQGDVERPTERDFFYVLRR